MSGQWRVGFAGPTALDYTPLFMRMARMRLDDEQWHELYADVRTLEEAALQAMTESN